MTPAATHFLAVQRARTTPYVLALLSIAGFAYFQENALPLVLGLAAALVAWLIVESPHGKPLPKIIINTVVVCATIFLWGELQNGDRNFVAALGHFITVLLLCKFFERKEARDLYQIVILSLLLMIASAMYSSTLVFAVLLAAYIALLVYVMVLFQMQASLAAAGGTLVEPAASPASDRVFSHDVRKTAFRCMVLLVPIAVTVFLLLPRTRSGSVFSSWGAGGGTFETGFSESIQFHDYGHLSQSDEMVMEVKLTRHGENAGSEWYAPYFRGQILDTYDVGRWSRAATVTKADSAELPFVNGSAVILPEQAYSQNLIIQEYTLYHTVGRTLFEMAPPVYIASDHLPGVWFNRRNISVSSTGPDTPTVQYTVASLPTFDSTLLPAPPPLPPDPNVRPMNIPAEITALAHTILGDALPPANQKPSPEQIYPMVEKLENYLRANYRYSLEFRQQKAELDPTVDFILNRKKVGGSCEYFASAMVMLSRSVGLSARIVNGYLGGEFNSIGGYYIVRQKDSHAWAEIYIPGEGWLQSDPTPPAILTADASESFIKHWGGEVSQFIENVWQAAVVSFDNESRHSVVEWLASAFQRPLGTFADFWNAIAFSVSGPSADNWARLTLLGPITGLVTIGTWVFGRWRRERRQQARIGTLRKAVKLAGDTLFLDELFQLLARDAPGRGAIRLPHQTPREFVEEAIPALGNAAPDARWLVTTFYDLQFGFSRPTGELRAQIATALHRIRETLGTRGPR